MSDTCPLPPGRAIALAAILDAHPRRMPHWTDWAHHLRAWGEAHLQTEHETKERDDVAQD
jgi:hypothetical protein